MRSLTRLDGVNWQIELWCWPPHPITPNEADRREGSFGLVGGGGLDPVGSGSRRGQRGSRGGVHCITCSAISCLFSSSIFCCSLVWSMMFLPPISNLLSMACRKEGGNRWGVRAHSCSKASRATLLQRRRNQRITGCFPQNTMTFAVLMG